MRIVSVIEVIVPAPYQKPQRRADSWRFPRSRSMNQSCDILIVGAGPAGLMAAETAAKAGASVVVFDQAPSPARKFLLAGRGGLNLTHSEPLDRFVARYGEAAARLNSAIAAFPPEALRVWCEALGEETFVGSSGRVFPRSFKASPLLRAWLRRLTSLGVEIRARHRWAGFAENGGLIVESPVERSIWRAEAIVLACGGGSWPRLGSDGGWTSLLRERGVAIAPLKPANCGFAVAWSELFRARFAGAPLKAAALSFGEARVRGEAMIGGEGIEGGAVYTLSAALRDVIEKEGGATLLVDLKPDVDVETLASRLSKAKPSQSLSTVLRKAAGLSPVAAALAREAGAAPREAEALARWIKNLPLTLVGVAPIARAISSAGGIAWDEIDEHFMLRRLPGVFVAGEMIDWEAPTGGYLLQACLATGRAAGAGAKRWLNSMRPNYSSRRSVR
jgi:uncharacterized flavoprotein (TIGR03862 family)